MPIQVEVKGVGLVEFPDGMSQDEIKSVLTKKFGKRESISDRLLAPGQSLFGMDVKTDPTQPEMSYKDKFDRGQRQAMLAGRYLTEGATAIPNMLGDVVGLDSSGAVSGALDAAGFPNPATPKERIVGDASRAVAGTIPTVGMGGLLGGAGPVAKGVGEALSTAPTLQAASAASAGASGGTAREMGASPAMQTLAALGGGVAIPAITAAPIVGGYRGVKAASQPFTKTGRERIVGGKLRSLAKDPTAAMNNIDESVPIIPGSDPTTAQAAKDYGLLIAEKGLRASSPQAGARFADRLSRNNEARFMLLDAIAQDDAAIAAAKAARDAATKGAREAAFANKGTANFQKVIDKIDDILSSPAGKRSMVRRSLLPLRKQLDGTDDPEALYEIRKDINDILGGKLQGDAANLKQASSQLIDVKGTIDDVLEASSPGFKGYVSKYAELSKPINQMEMGQEIANRSMLAAPDTQTGVPVLSQAKFTRVLRNKADDLKKVMTKGQLDDLDRIAKDLDVGVQSEASGKAVGSNTFQNFSTANVVGSIMGGGEANPLMSTLMRPLSWVYKVPDEAMTELMVDAMLDPKLGRALMAKATPGNVNRVSSLLANKARAMGLGSIIGATTQKSQQLR